MCELESSCPSNKKAENGQSLMVQSENQSSCLDIDVTLRRVEFTRQMIYFTL